MSFEKHDECAINVPVGSNKCGRGYEVCPGKDCKDYVLPAHILERQAKEKRLEECRRQVAALNKEIEALTEELRGPQEEEEETETPKRGRPRKC